MKHKKKNEQCHPVRTVRREPDVALRVPGSKSITNRAFLLAAFANGTSTLRNALESDDTNVFSQCLNALGIEARKGDDGSVTVTGQGTIPEMERADLYVENAGTACRFLIPACATSMGEFHFDGTERMRQRPLSELLDSVQRLGARIHPHGSAHLPLSVMASGISGGTIDVDTSRSSQFLSGLMMASIRASDDLAIRRTGDLVGRPYVDITYEMMRAFNITIRRDGYEEFVAPAGQQYTGIEYAVEPDASTASYFFAAALLTGGRIEVLGLHRESSVQGDIRFLDVLEEAGADVKTTEKGTEIAGCGRIKGIDVDMKDISDTFMTLAVLAPFADGPTTIRGIAHTRGQESDRVDAIATELRRLGSDVSTQHDSMTIRPSKLKGCAVRTYDDHRIAMALSLVGLKVPGVVITGADCVGKTAPRYFELLRLVEDSGTHG
jgi:3-phosphoshikimate 1-carboxyvinyltransferase